MNPSLPLLLALSLGAAQKPAAKPEPPPPPKPKVQEIFAHAPHQGVVECADCHAGIEKAKGLGERHIPAVAKCSECHDDKAPPARAPVEWHLVFSHADHLPRVKGDCATCHKALPEPTRAAVSPPMSTCTACHNHADDFGRGRCTLCHVDLKSYPLRPVSAFSHEGDFLRTHGPLARSDVQACMICHDQTKCAECHSATTRPFKSELAFPEKVEAALIHRGDFVSRHTIEARAEPASCRRCHGSAFCESCHREQNLSPALAAPRTPHPPAQEWMRIHGTEARANIVACAGCHDQGASAVCVQCHRTGGVNPHPPGWTGRHSAADQAKNSMCRICHT
jgi:hypothetical protein